MKLESRRVEAFLRDPGAIRVALLYGEDAGLIRERAGRLVRAVAGTADDPFRVAELEPEAVGSIPAEMASLPLTGGRRVVRVRDAGDAAAGPVQAVLSGPAPGFLILEARGLGSRSKLRTVVERSAEAAAIGCYPEEGRSLEQTIQGTLAALSVTADADALKWLGDQLGADQAMTRMEVEKLALLAGRGGRVDVEMARAAVGDLAGLSLDDALYAATAGDTVATDRALELAMAEGAAPVGVLRAALMHLQRLERARLTVDGGMTLAEAMKTIRPPLFFRREGPFTQALGLWSLSALETACTRVWEAERACKRTGFPAEAICRNALMALAQRAAAARRGAGSLSVA
jgi:DNA polymerase-3 subunit delta